MTFEELALVSVGSWIQEVLSGLDGPRRGKNTKLKLARPRVVVEVEFKTNSILVARVKFRDTSIRLTARVDDPRYRLVPAPTAAQIKEYALLAEESKEEFFPGV